MSLEDMCECACSCVKKTRMESDGFEREGAGRQGKEGDLYGRAETFAVLEDSPKVWMAYASDERFPWLLRFHRW